MREIKFRAWDDKAKKWLLGYEYPNLGGFSLYGETVLMGEWSTVLDTYVFERGEHKADDLKVMQYTGLKDKNGVEIYEGDIVREDDAYDVEQYEVGFAQAGFWLKNRDANEYGWPELSEIEVIGNIYENPELLK